MRNRKKGAAMATAIFAMTIFMSFGMLIVDCCMDISYNVRHNGEMFVQTDHLSRIGDYFVYCFSCDEQFDRDRFAVYTDDTGRRVEYFFETSYYVDADGNDVASMVVMSGVSRLFKVVAQKVTDGQNTSVQILKWTYHPSSV